MMLKIFLISSSILNSFLLIFLFGLIPFFLFISVVLNICMVAYLRFLLNERQKTQNDTNALMIKIDNFLVHLNDIHGLEMFYGDETLQNLLNHSKDLINSFYEYEKEYFNDYGEGDHLNDSEEEDRPQESPEKEEFIFHEDS